MKRLIFLSCLLAAACGPSLRTVNPDGGVVDGINRINRGDAMESAERYCRKSGRSARITGQTMFGNSFTFECVRP